MAVDTVEDYEGLGFARIEHGTGVIDRVEHEEGKRNAKVTVKVDGLQHPLYGWADVNELPPLDRLVKGLPVGYRIVVHRKRGIALDRPFDSLGNGEKVRDLVALTPAGGTVEARAQAADVGAATERAVFPNGRPPEPSTELVRASEGKPWELYNSDGRLNYGSYATLAAAGMVELAHTATLASKPGAVPLPGFVHKLAAALLGVADEVQQAATGALDRMATSHTRARGFVRCAVEAMPVPLDASTEERIAWRDSVQRHATELFRAAADLTERHAAYH